MHQIGCLFLCVDSQKGFFPGVESFFFLCVWTARWHGFSLWAARPLPGGRADRGDRDPPSVPKTLFSERPFFIVAIRLKPFCLDMVMGIIDACYSVGPPLCFAGCGTRLPFLVFFMSLLSSFDMSCAVCIHCKDTIPGCTGGADCPTISDVNANANIFSTQALGSVPKVTHLFTSPTDAALF